MRKCLVGLCALLILLVFAVPALAMDVNLNVNGKAYQPVTQAQLLEGTTMVPLYAVERISGADISSTDQLITIHKGATTLLLTMNSTEASLNNSLITLPQAPVLLNGEVMIPIRAVLESLGVTIDWAADTKTVLVSFQEQRQEMSPEELLLKSTETMATFNSYKAKIDMQQEMEMVNPETGETQQMDMQMIMDMAMQNEPVLLYAITEATVTSDEMAEAETLTTEMLMNEDGLYTTMPEEGWVKLNIPGMDMKALLEESNQDPLKSLQQLTEAGVLLSFGNDQEKNGQSYWVLNVTMGPDSFREILDQVITSIPLPQDEDPTTGEQLNTMYQKMFASMKADIYYSTWINQDTLIPEFMEIFSTMEINTDIPAPSEEEKPIVVNVSLQQSGSYEMYGFDVPFSVPDVSDAKDLQDLNLDTKTELAPDSVEQ